MGMTSPEMQVSTQSRDDASYILLAALMILGFLGALMLPLVALAI
jgi:hypothetical protein